MKHWDTLKSGDFSGHVTNALAALEADGFRHMFPEANGAVAPGGVEDIGTEPVLLAYSPLARMNKFQALLYSEAGRHGVAATPLTQHAHVNNVPWLGRFIFHVHWVGDLVKFAETQQHAEERIADFLTLLDTLKAARGAKIVWTAHNTLPHDSKIPDLDRKLRREVIRRCDAVHLLSEATRTPLKELFGLDDAKTFLAPHPTYDGAYPDFLSRDQARQELGVPQDAYVFLFFGSLQPYKGVDALCAAFERAAERCDRPTTLLIAGIPTDQAVAAAAERWAAARPDALVEAVRIPDDLVHLFYRAADVNVIPYREALNSGVLLLAMTFRTPAIAPNVGAFKEFAGRGLATYEPGEAALEDAMVAAANGALEERFAMDDALLAALSPKAASNAFFTRLFETLGWRRSLDGSDAS